MFINFPYHVACCVFEQTCRGFCMVMLCSILVNILSYFMGSLKIHSGGAGSNLLHVVVPGDFAGRLIGKKGAHVQEQRVGVAVAVVCCVFFRDVFQVYRCYRYHSPKF